MTIKQAIGRRIRARRRRLCLSQRELGRLIYTSGEEICKLERGDGPINGYLAGIAEALGVSVEWLRQ